MNLFPAAGSAAVDLGGRSPPPETSPVRRMRTNRAGGPRFRTARGSPLGTHSGHSPGALQVGLGLSMVQVKLEMGGRQTRWVSISRRIWRLMDLSVRAGWEDHQNPSACMARAAARNLSATASKSASL